MSLWDGLIVLHDAGACQGPTIMTKRETWLLEVARDVRRHLVNRVEGRTYLGGKHDEIFLARRLTTVLALYEEIEPVHDLDRQDRKAIVLTDVPQRW